MITEQSKPEPTDEQEENARQQAASYRFLRRHLDFKMNSKNAGLIAAFLRVNNLPWTDENLERAYAGMEDSFEHGENEPEAPPKKDEPKWSGLTKSDIKNMPPAEYRANLKDPDFVIAVERLGIKRSDL